MDAALSSPLRLSRPVLFSAAAVLLLLLCLASLATGFRPVPLLAVRDALFAYDPTLADHIAVRDYRLPRTLLGLLCGAAFGVAGALMQAVTRNPLADPGLLGVNAGAAFAVIIAAGVFGFGSISAYLWFAFAGAVLAVLSVYALGAGGRGGAAPLRLVLAGVALSAVLGGFGTAITLLNPVAFDGIRVWALGSLAGRDMGVVSTVAPFIAAGLVLALLAAPGLNAIALGDDLARTLGSRLGLTRLATVLAVTLLAGAGTAAVGPIGFVGLMVPHAVRSITGPDQRLVVAGSALLAPSLLIAADIVGRMLLQPGELEAGLVTAFLGAPVLVFLARKKRGGEA